MVPGVEDVGCIGFAEGFRGYGVRFRGILR